MAGYGSSSSYINVFGGRADFPCLCFLMELSFRGGDSGLNGDEEFEYNIARLPLPTWKPSL